MTKGCLQPRSSHVMTFYRFIALGFQKILEVDHLAG